MRSSNDDAADHSATVSAAASTSNAFVPFVEALDKSAESEASPFHEGEKVLAFHGPCIYDAKVQKVEFRADGWAYFIHYSGWNKVWDEWLGVDRMLKRTEENIQKQNELKAKLAAQKNAKLVLPSLDKFKSSNGLSGKKRNHETVDEEVIAPLEKLINIQIPITLKTQLLDDYECVAQMGQLYMLPRSPNVHRILGKYFDYRVKNDGEIVTSVTEVVAGLLHLFDKALPTLLLYKNEHQQYKEKMHNNMSPSSVYGAEHLLRLFVKLPERLSSMCIETNTMTEFQQRINDFLRFFGKNQAMFFHSNYQRPEGFLSLVKKEES